NQRREMVDGVDRHHSNMYEPEERGEEREAFAYGPEQLIEDQSYDGVADERGEVGGTAKTVERLVREDVGRCGRGVPRNHEPVAHEDLGEGGADDDDQVERTREPRFGTHSMLIRGREEESSKRPTWAAAAGRGACSTKESLAGAGL